MTDTRTQAPHTRAIRRDAKPPTSRAQRWIAALLTSSERAEGRPRQAEERQEVRR